VLPPLDVDGAGAGAGAGAGSDVGVVDGALIVESGVVDGVVGSALPEPPPHPDSIKENIANVMSERFFGKGVVILIKLVPFAFQLNELFLMGNISVGSLKK
jgi:hypothetical protein